MPPAVVAPPPSPVDPVIEVLHGLELTDPYRWLEDQNSPRTRKWLEKQAIYTRAYLDAIPGREEIKERAKQLLALKEVVSEPWNVGDRYFFVKHMKDEEQPVIVMRDGLFGDEAVLVDPASRGTGASTSVSIVAISEGCRFLAYSVRLGGTDHSAIEVLDLERHIVLPDKIPEGVCTGFVFALDGSGFYYSHREVHDQRPNYRAVLWHGLGTDWSQDKEVFFAGEAQDLFVGVLCSPEANLLVYPVFTTGRAPRTSLYLQRMPHRTAHARLLLKDIEGCFVPFFANGQLFAFTDHEAPNCRIVQIDLVSPEPAHWRDVVPESSHRIQQFAVAADHVFVTRVERFATKLEAFPLERGNETKTLLSIYGSIDLLNTTMNSEKLFYSQTSICEPPSIQSYDTRYKRHFTCDKAELLELPEIELEEFAHPSRDKTTIPLLLAARRDLLDSGPLPTFLSGYGGFGSCVTPRFTAFASFLMEQGFLIAVPALRGGSELGEQWHRAGMRENRQNSFDDFIAAAECLIAEGRSQAGRIAIGGGSNAGLLVGAAITQRPDLFRAAICLGPLLDMTRYHLFDRAAGWADEYGSPEDEQDFHSLLHYSPYHRVRDDGAQYPAVLLISGDADTRCNPMHARKMTARLQAANRSQNPILLDYKPAWGHTPVQPLSVKIESLTDRLAFVCHELGVPIQQRRTA